MFRTKLWGYTLATLLLLTPLATHAETAENAGFITRNFWYLPQEYFSGDSVRLYAALMNSSGEAMSGTVVFYVDDVSIGTRAFAMRESDAVFSVWYDWKADGGTHTFNAKITNTTLQESTASSTPLVQTFSTKVSATTKEVSLVVTPSTAASSSEPGTTTPPSVETYTTKVGESIDAVAENLRTKLENARDSIDKKLTAQTHASSTKLTLPRVLGDATSSDARQVVSSDTNDVPSTGSWYLHPTRAILSIGISLLSHPLGVSALLLFTLFLLVKTLQVIWYKMTLKK